MAITTTTQIDAPVNRKLQRRFLSRAKAKCLYFAGSMPGDVLESHSGTFTVLWRRYENLAPSTSALSELTGTLTHPTRAGTQISKTDITATVQKYGQHMFLTEEVQLQELSTLGIEIIDIFAISGGRSLNRLQRNIVEDNFTIVYEGGGSTDGGVTDSISRNSIRQAVNVLNRNDATLFDAMSFGSQNIGSLPVRDSYWGFCHSDVEEDIRDLDGFISVEQYGGHVQTHFGEFGTVGGVRFMSSSEGSIDTDSGGAPGAGIRSNGGSAADLYTTVIIGQEAHGALSLDVELIRETYLAGDRIPGLMLISKGKGSAGTGDPLDEVSSTAYKAWHAGAIKNSTWGRSIRSGASKLV